MTTNKTIYSAAELMAMEIDDVKFLMDPYLPEGGITLLHGKFGSFKTPLALNICKAIAIGEELWGFKTEKTTPLLFLEVDSPKPVIVPRMKKLGFDETDDIDFCLGYPGFNVMTRDKGGRESVSERKVRVELEEMHNKRQYKAVFIDVLRGIHKEPDKDSEVPHQVYRALANMFPGAALFIIHHERKAKPKGEGGPKDEMFSGSQAWANHATVVVRVDPANKSESELRLVHTKSQASALQPPIILKVQDDGVHVDLKSKATAEAVLFVINSIRKKNPDVSLASLDYQVADALGISVRTARRRRKEAQSPGHD